MKLNRKLVLILSLVLSLALATGGTLAYLSDTDADVNVMTLGNVHIVQNEQERDETGALVPFTQNKPLYPSVYSGNSPVWARPNAWPVPNDANWAILEDRELVVDKFVTVTNTGNTPVYVRTIVAVESTANPAEDGEYIAVVVNAGVSAGEDVMSDWLWLTGDESLPIGDKYFHVASVTYLQPLQPGETSLPSLKQIFMTKEADNEFVSKLGENYDVLVLSQAVQAAGFDDAQTALDAAFGEVNLANAAAWLGGEAIGDVGSPGEDWPNNNPPVIPVGAIQVTNTDELKQALTDAKSNPGTQIYLAEGAYNLGSFSVPADTTLFGMSEEVVIEGCLTGTVKNVTLENIHIKGGNSQRWARASGDNTFTNCTFEATSVYALHFDSIDEGATLTYKNCAFIGWCAIGSGKGPYELTFDGCSLTGNGTYGLIRCYRDATIKNCTFDVDNVNTADVYQDGVHAVDCTITMIDCTNVNSSVEALTNVSGTGVVNVQ